MEKYKNILVILVLIVSTLFIGCTESVGGVVVVQDISEYSLDLLKGVVSD